MIGVAICRKCGNPAPCDCTNIEKVAEQINNLSPEQIVALVQSLHPAQQLVMVGVLIEHIQGNERTY